ncbi:hypothetical protein AAF712_013966 [Marasmius tenuissimus]|uniref:MACPF domain-containing protein n=1 Tax=Marasmius tenuissimus TaxID=585030 RepID=A0ABR2ZEB7_9AGAR
MAELPASGLLGYSMNMATARPPLTPNQTSRHILQFDQDEARPVDIDGQTYSVPRHIAVSQNLPGGETFTTFPTGQEAIANFESNPGLIPRLLHIAGGDSVLKAITTKCIRPDDQYAFYSLRQPRFSATLSNFNTLFKPDSNSFLSTVRRLPPFSGQNQSAVAQYQAFFQRFGSHIVTGVEYGSTYQFINWADRTQPGVNDAWDELVKADYDGIPSRGQFDEKIKETDQYKQYLRLKQHIEGMGGGDQELAQSILRSPNYQTFQEWKATGVGQDISPVYFSLVDIWMLMKNSDNIDVVRAAMDVMAAYEWFVNHGELN